MKSLLLCGAIFVLTQLQGCLALGVAGATSVAVIATDPRTSDQQLADQRIELDVDKLLAKAPYKSDNSRFSDVSFYGTVLLVGQSKDMSLVSSLIPKIKAITSVTKVYNQVRYIDPIGIGQISKDTYITSKVKTAMVADKNLTSNAVKVLTENSEVFLLGKVSHKQGALAAEIARNVNGVSQVIVAFEFTD